MLSMISSFWKATKKDPEEIWIHLCQPGEKQQRALKCCQIFLRNLATKSKQWRIAAEHADRQAQRSIRSATTVLHYWRLLVLGFDNEVLARKRAEDVPNAAQWSLKFKHGIQTNAKGTGPIYDIVRVSHQRVLISHFPKVANLFFSYQLLVDRTRG